MRRAIALPVPTPPVSPPAPLHNKPRHAPLAAPDHPHRRASDPRITRLAERAALLGFEVVDFAGFVDDLDRRSADQIESLKRTRATADEVITASAAIADGVETMRGATGSAAQMIKASVDRVHAAGKQSTEVVRHIADMADQVSRVVSALKQVQDSNDSIRDIATQVNMLAINARIEASRAGEAGAGFATIASAINALSVTTAETARTIRDGVEGLSRTLRRLTEESAAVRTRTDQVIRDNAATDQDLGRIADTMAALRDRAGAVLQEATRVRGATGTFAPAFEAIDASIGDTAGRIADVRARGNGLIDHTEAMVQDTVSLGGATPDQPFIDRVSEDAAKISALLEAALETGKITEPALFARRYQSIPDTRPQQMLAPFTALADELFEPVQEAALRLSDKVVFCVALNQDGYLPTHNRKFSQKQGADEAWNTAHCRNRRIFDDRVGLKSGRNTRPFLLQVYRRDMGGGTFKLMKDVSAPITVRGRHWGGLRLAYLA